LFRDSRDGGALVTVIMAPGTSCSYYYYYYCYYYYYLHLQTEFDEDRCTQFRVVMIM